MKLLILTLTVSFGASAALAQSSTVSAQAAATSASTGTLAAPSSIIEPIKNPKKWSTTAYYGVYNGVNKVNSGDADSGEAADAFVQLRRDIGNGQKLALRVSGMYNQTDGTREDEWALYDPQFIYSFPIFQSSFRLSMPVSEWSQDIGRIELRYNGGHDMFQSGKFTVSSLVESRAYAYTKEEDGQRSFRNRLGASATYEVNPYFSPYFAAIYEVNNYYHGVGQNIEGNMRDRQEKLDVTYLDLGAEINVIPKVLNINAYIEQARARSSGADQEIFNEDQTAYNVEFMLSM